MSFISHLSVIGQPAPIDMRLAAGGAAHPVVAIRCAAGLPNDGAPFLSLVAGGGE
jgi:hypothetical protein